MEFKVSSEILVQYKNTKKNVNYMLDYILSSIDYKNCNKYFNIIGNITFRGDKTEVEISDENVKFVKDIFKKIDDELVEILLWVALLFYEV